MVVSLIFSCLAANTHGLAFAVSVSVVARYIQHVIGLGGVFESPKTQAKYNIKNQYVTYLAQTGWSLAP